MGNFTEIYTGVYFHSSLVKLSGSYSAHIQMQIHNPYPFGATMLSTKLRFLLALTPTDSIAFKRLLDVRVFQCYSLATSTPLCVFISVHNCRYERFSMKQHPMVVRWEDRLELEEGNLFVNIEFHLVVRWMSTASQLSSSDQASHVSFGAVVFFCFFSLTAACIISLQTRTWGSQ